MVAQFDEGMVLKPAIGFQRLAQTAGVPRDNHYVRAERRGLKIPERFDPSSALLRLS